MDFLDKKITDYAERFTSPETTLLRELNRYTYDNVQIPEMLSGHLQGRFLSLVSRLISPKQVLEIGTYTGYSAICIAEGLAEGGMIHTIDGNENLKEMALKYFKEAGYEHQIKLYTGDAPEIVPTIDETFDLVFIDADKTNYSLYFDQVIDKVRPGGLILADNVLWSGEVLEPVMERQAEALHEYNKKIHSDDRVFNVLIPVRDGLMAAQKIV